MKHEQEEQEKREKGGSNFEGNHEKHDRSQHDELKYDQDANELCGIDHSSNSFTMGFKLTE